MPGDDRSSSNGSYVTAAISSERRQAEDPVEKARFRKERQDAEGEHVAAEESARSQEVKRLSRDAINRSVKGA